MCSLYGAPEYINPPPPLAGLRHSPSPACGGGQGGGFFRQQERVSTVSFGDESRPKNLESGFTEPGEVRLSVRMTPVHRCPVPVRFCSRPSPGSHCRQQVSTRAEPPT